ncbi:MAG: DUF302 domain-containing protein [Rhizobiaceae bacterium]|nr:DUF302 domain-containing protein [Rhizobiaceae bacterium]
MKNLFTTFLSGIFLLAATLFVQAQDGWIIKDSANSVKVTADKLVAIIEAAPPKLFARVEHHRGAEKAGLELGEATMIMFGAPPIGTPIMQQNIKAGLDLPVRVLIWDDAGQTKIGYLDPQALKARYGIEGADEAFKKMAGAVGKFTDGAAAAE